MRVKHFLNLVLCIAYLAQLHPAVAADAAPKSAAPQGFLSRCKQALAPRWNADLRDGGILRHLIATGVLLGDPAPRLMAKDSFAFSPSTFSIQSSHLEKDDVILFTPQQQGQALMRVQGRTYAVTLAPHSATARPMGYRESAAPTHALLSYAGIRARRVQDYAAGDGRVVFSEDATYMATSFNGGSNAFGNSFVRMLEVETGKRIFNHIDRHDFSSDPAISPDGKRIAIATIDNHVQVFDVKSGRLIRTYTAHKDWVVNMTFSPDSKYLATASHDKTAHVFDVDSDKTILAYKGHADWVVDVAYSSDGKYIATASDDKTARVIEIETGRTVLVSMGHDKALTSVAFSPDNKRIVTTSDDGTARVIDIESGSVVLTYRGHSRPVMSAAFSPDGLIIVTASKDESVRVVEVETGREVIISIGHSDAVMRAAFSTDGIRLMTATFDGTARILEVTPTYTIANERNGE